MTSSTKNTRAVSVFAAVLLVAAQLLSPIAAFVPRAAADSYVVDGKITICHRTDSYSNPYVQITVDQNAADGIAGNSGNEADHYSEHQGPVFYQSIPKHTEWGDIIPPIDGVHDGLNWTKDGQDIWENGCNMTETGSVTVNKCVDTTGTGSYTCDKAVVSPLGFQWSFAEDTPTWNNMDTTTTNVPVGTYSITEKQADGYSFTGWYETGSGKYSCTNPEVTSLPASVEAKKNKVTSITLCNQADPTITLIKKVINNNGGTAQPDDFGLSIGGTSVKSDEKLSLPTGSYVVNEKGLTSYTFVSITGDGCPDQLGGIVSLKMGQNVICTITNDDVAPKLTLVKNVVNTYGGQAEAKNWTLTAAGTSTLSGTSGVTSDSTFQAGTYALSESTGPGGYTPSNWSCDNAVVTNSQITLTTGQTTTCTITNSDTPATLKVVKVAQPSTNQTFSFTSADLGNFTLTGDGSDASTKTFTGLSAGNYTFSENTTDNWTNQYISCRNEQYSWDGAPITVHLNMGDNVTCFVLNTEKNTIAGHKFNDVNDNHQWDNGEPTLKNWTITLTGCTEQSEEVLSILTSGRDNSTCAHTVSRTTTTDATGAYSFDDLDPGTYTVCEVQQPTWTQTYPQSNNGCHIITFDIEDYGQVATADFGNYPDPQVLGSSTTTTSPKLLVNTGMEASQNLLVGMVILGVLGAMHVASRRQLANK